MQNVVEAAVDPQFLFHDGHQHVHADGNPELGLHRVFAGAVEGFDPQMLLDPLEEQFDLPAALVELRDGQRGQGDAEGAEAAFVAKVKALAPKYRTELLPQTRTPGLTAIYNPRSFAIGRVFRTSGRTPRSVRDSNSADGDAWSG